MFRSKNDVDRHVKDIFTRLKSSEERILRCYNVAKLYYHVRDYESAKKYVCNYLEIRDKSAGAHKLLGQILEALGQKEGAFIEYKISLELEPKQDDLVLKVGELLSDMNNSIDINTIKYWIERADKKFPHHPIVFKLKEKMLILEKPNGKDDDLEKLITSELSVRQTDVDLQIKLIKHYVKNCRLKEAYDQALGIELVHRNNLSWYQSLCELLVRCKESKQSDWTFWIFYISVMERYVALYLQEQANFVSKNIQDVTQALYSFDQCLFEFKSKNLNNSSFIEHILLHMWGQLHFHLACLILRRSKAGEYSWPEVGRLCTPLLLTALHVTPIDFTAAWTMHLKDRLKNQILIWNREGAYRCSQAGHVLQDYACDNSKKLLDTIDKFCTSSWRKRVYQRVFINRLFQNGKTTSYFVTASFSNPPLRLCSYNELRRFDEISEEVWPDSLHHQVWLGLRSLPRNLQNNDNGPQPNATSHVFCELQYSVYNLHQAAPDSLSRLDIDAFLNAAIFCASSVLKERESFILADPERLPTLPADLTPFLTGWTEQRWWSYAYKVYSMDKQKPFDDDLGELRLELQRGLEVVRCLGNHGLHPVLLIHLARIFHHRAETLRETDPESSNIPDLEARSEMYWSAAIPILERIQNNQFVALSNSKFFNYRGEDISGAELVKALEEGKLLLAQRFVRDEQYEKAIDALQALNCPEASFQQGRIYEKLADKIVSSIPKESLTSEMRSQHIIMLSKARGCFYLTLDRLRSPGINPKHPLNAELSMHITDIENKLKRIDPDLSHGDLSRNECDGMSDESYSSVHSTIDPAVTNTVLPTFSGLSPSITILSTPQKTAQRTPKQSSTPYKPHYQDITDLSRNRTEARPSLERLDAQIRAINHMSNSKNSMMQSISEQNKTILDMNKTVMDKVEKLAKEVAELRKEIQKQRSSRAVNVNPSLEDLCILNEDDYSDMNYNTNQPGVTSSISGNIYQPSLRHPYSQLVYPSAAFQGYYPAGMTFNDPNAQTVPSMYPPSVYSMPVLYPNIRSKMPENILQQGLFIPPTNPPLQIPIQKVETPKMETALKDVSINKVPPVNVAVTTSDTLPIPISSIQPTQSVTIPPHFRQENTSASITTGQPAPHCYQISMPNQATVLTTVNLPPLSSTLTTTPANISIPGTLKQDTFVCSTGSPPISDYDQDPIPDFVPIVPLPAEVKIITGEEGQETLFCVRAKLYRFVGNEWKERGIGEVKLLRNDEGKVRLLMRREQVLKVCANHYLAPDMELTAKPNNEKAWFWVANDFADGELKIEKFCLKFETIEEGISFKEHFDKAKASLAPLSDTVTDNPDKSSRKQGVVPSNIKRSEKPKVAAQPVEQTEVVEKQHAVTSTTATTTPETIASEVAKTSTVTTVVGGFSFTSTPNIHKVAVSEMPKDPVKSDVSPFIGFRFNKTVSSTESFSATPAMSMTTANTVASQFTFSFANTTKPFQSESATIPITANTYTTPILSSQHSGTTTNENFTSNASQFGLRRPLAPASNISIPSAAMGVQDKDTLDIQSEHEELLFSEKSSFQAYNYNMKQWDIKGTGQIKVLWSCMSNKMRLLMIDENSSEVCCNYNIVATMPFTLNSGNNTVVSWTDQSGSDNKSLFAAVFKTSSQAAQFHNTIVSNQQKMVKDSISTNNLTKQEATQNVQATTKQTSLSEMFKPPVGSWECNTCYTRNGVTDVKCIACNVPKVPEASTLDTSTATSQNQIPLSQMFKPPANSWKCKCCDIFNVAETNYCVACDTSKDPSLPPKPKADGFKINTSTSGATPTFTFGIPQDTAKKTTGGFSFLFSTSNNVSADSKSVSTTATNYDTKTDTSAAKFSFEMPHRPNTPTNKESSFNFGLSGNTFEFNLESKSSPTKSVGEDKNEDEVEENDDIYFLPTIPLPDEIEVKTGEENEELLYRHRAKLYRYDNAENEWKERGLGDIKLLRHKETGKLRLVMRREQILKLCLNHLVLPNFELKPKDEKSWWWCAADYSEGEIERTLFACRFKTSEIAQGFKNAIEDAKGKLSLDESTNEVAKKGSPVQDIEVLYQVTVTPEQKEVARGLQLPDNFYAYQQKPNCSGCRGCIEPTTPLFQSEDSNKIDKKTLSKKKTVSKALAANQTPPTTLTTREIHSKSTALNAAPTTVTTSQTSISDTSKNTFVFKSEMDSTSTTQSLNTFSTTTASNLSFGNIDLSTTNDKKTSFSFIMPQIQSSENEVQKCTSEKQSTVIPENLHICSPISTQPNTLFSSMVPTCTTTTTSKFEVTSVNNAMKDIFGGMPKKETSALIKPSTVSVSVNNPESIYNSNFNSESNTTSTTASSVFGSTNPIFGTTSLKTEIDNTISSISFSTTTAPITSSTTDASVRSTNSVFSNTTPFTFNLLSETRTTGSAFPISNSTSNAFEAITSSASETQKEAEDPFFTTTDISFSSLAAKSTQPAFKTDANFSFVGAGSAVFGSKPNVAHNKTSTTTKDSLAENKDENEEDSYQADNDQDHDPHFEPIIPLPDFVEVSTGEEDEEKVFCQRAKLYRFNQETREWKERGIGEMKILHHEQRNVYRLLLRREKIHKVVCNLLLTPEIQFTKLASSDCTWVWAGLNYVDDEPCIEKLAVKFKTVELADEFMAVVNKIQDTLRTSSKK